MPKQSLAAVAEPEPEAVAGEEIFTEEQGAAFYQVKPQTFAKWRMQGIGPKYFRIGHGRGAIRYFKSELIRHAKENLLRAA